MIQAITVDVYRPASIGQRMVICQDRYAGYRALWLKVIIRAIFDWVCYRDSTKLEKKKMADNAHVWLFEPSELVNGLDSLCQSLDISPKDVRDKARQMSKEQIAKIEHLERDSGDPGVRSLLEEIGDELEEV